MSVSVPDPAWVTEPEPEMVPSKVTSSERLKTRAPSLATSPVMAPVLPPLPICSVPAEMVVPPPWLLAPVSVSVPVPAWVRVPWPDTSPVKVRSSDRLKTSAASTLTLPARLPDVPPSPTCSVPPEMLVPPSWVSSPVRISVPSPVLA